MGACVQLYTLRSEKLGIGDFGDLQSMLTDVAKRGGAFIGLNLIHALPGKPGAPACTALIPPLLNVIYIDVNAVDDFRLSKEAQAWWNTPATQTLQRARDAEWVDYSAVTALKMTALRMGMERFCAS